MEEYRFNSNSSNNFGEQGGRSCDINIGNYNEVLDFNNNYQNKDDSYNYYLFNQLNFRLLGNFVTISFLMFLILINLLKFTSFSNNIILSRHRAISNTHIQVDSKNPCIIEYGYYDHHCIQISNVSNVYSSNNNKRIYRISLHGDSLVTRTNQLYNFSSNLLKQIQHTYPNLIFDIIVCANSGQNIKSILYNLDEQCLVYNPHSIIIFGDSDKEIFQKHLAEDIKSYRDNLIRIINILKHTVVNIAIAGNYY